MRLVVSEEVDEQTCRQSAVPPMIRSQVIEQGICFYRAPEQDHAAGLPIAVIPLLIGAQVIGVISILKLLKQKSELSPVDFELFDMLANHAAIALHRSIVFDDVGGTLQEPASSDLIDNIVLS